MNVAMLEPVVDRLRERRSLVRADAERIAAGEPRLDAVAELIRSLEEELDLLLSFDADPGRRGAPARALWLQHHRLRQHADALDALLDVLLHFEISEPWQRASARVLLADFARELGDHLSFEEQNGCLERAAEAEPRLAERVVSLRDEHDDFRKAAARLVAEAFEIDAGSCSWEPLRRRFESLCDALRVHEQAEADLVYEAYLLDLGGSG